MPLVSPLRDLDRSSYTQWPFLFFPPDDVIIAQLEDGMGERERDLVCVGKMASVGITTPTFRLVGGGGVGTGRELGFCHVPDILDRGSEHFRAAPVTVSHFFAQSIGCWHTHTSGAIPLTKGVTNVGGGGDLQIAKHTT